MKWRVFVAMILVILLLGAAAVAVFGFWLPYRNAESSMVQGQMKLQELHDGRVQLTWPQANVDGRYLLEIREEGISETPYVYLRVYTADNTWKLPPLPTDKLLTISVRTVVEYKQLWLEKERLSENELAIRTTLAAPTMQDMQWATDEESKTLTLTYGLDENQNCRLYWQDANGTWQEVRDTNETEQILTFGDHGEFPVPSFGGLAQFGADVYLENDDLIFYGNISYEFAVVRDDLLGRELNPVLTDDGYNVCTITWEETKGQYYQVQRLDRVTGEWDTLAEIPGDGNAPTPAIIWR